MFWRVAAQAVIFSEGILYLDNCDFSESNASVLVFSANHERATVRNTILGDKNCECTGGILVAM